MNIPKANPETLTMFSFLQEERRRINFPSHTNISNKYILIIFM